MIKSILVGILLSILLVQCRQSDHVVSGRAFQKRKYTAGWYHNKGAKKRDNKAIENTALKQSLPKETITEDQGLSASSTSETIVLTPITHSTSNSKAEKTIEKKQGSKKLFSQAEGQKKKKKKQQILLVAKVAYLFSFSGAMYFRWLLPSMNIPIIGIVLGALGVLIAIYGLFTISKKTKNKGRNVLLLCLTILLGLMVILLCAIFTAVA
jgi:cation transport ATPase